ncbi:arginase family protein [Asanoa sp. WMMD1127]|uniref:arginase family protein n=1 Tax=Asanoa sp. WMMD1127 TaxID=3016107 RepID=UPI002415FCBC|nr:arginase family protein [Asanoa sp. WMMD1127]MDG4825697.1 arginase family protein [Asanoa sp. WMMD1127]
MDVRWGLLGVPSSAGAHTPGLEQGPSAVRAAGLAELLPGGVADHGDVPGFRWRPDPGRPTAKNAAAVARVAADTAAATARILAAGQTPLVVGGDCSITVGVVAGFVAHGSPPALLYVDGGPDLYTPDTRANGNLDAMGVAHLLAIPGHVPEVAGPRAPLLTAGEVVSYGHSLPEGDVELALLDKLGIFHVHADEVHADPAGAAARALAAIEAAGPRFVLHCDVDVLSFNDTPLADVPDSGDEPTGLRLGELAASLAVFTASPRFAGLVLTEINPDHAPEPADLRRFVTTFAGSLATG